MHVTATDDYFRNVAREMRSRSSKALIDIPSNLNRIEKEVTSLKLELHKFPRNFDSDDNREQTRSETSRLADNSSRFSTLTKFTDSSPRK